MSRKRVIFIKAHTMSGLNWKVGHISMMRKEKANDLKERKIVKDYTGIWPPGKHKTKFNLKDLK